MSEENPKPPPSSPTKPPKSKGGSPKVSPSNPPVMAFPFTFRVQGSKKLLLKTLNDQFGARVEATVDLQGHRAQNAAMVTLAEMVEQSKTEPHEGLMVYARLNPPHSVEINISKVAIDLPENPETGKAFTVEEYEAFCASQIKEK